MTTTMSKTPPPAHRPRRSRRRFSWTNVVVGVALLISAVSLTLAWSNADQRAAVATGQAEELADPILELCVQGGAVARALAAEGRCALAEQVQAGPDVEPVLPPGVDRAEVARLVEAEVAELTLPPGQGPSSGQLLEIAERVFRENAELFRGPAGADASPEQIEIATAAGVNAYFERNPIRVPEDGIDGERGPMGDAGPEGPAGEPPVGWVTNYPDGARQDCSRTDPFDPAAPRYSCTFTPAPETPPTATEPTPPPLLGD